MQRGEEQAIAEGLEEEDQGAAESDEILGPHVRAALQVCIQHACLHVYLQAMTEGLVHTHVYTRPYRYLVSACQQKLMPCRARGRAGQAGTHDRGADTSLPGAPLLAFF